MTANNFVNMKKIIIEENLDNVKDILEISREENLENKNYIRLIDANTGRVLINRKHNIITHRGRTFALEKLYGDTNNLNSYSIKNLNRSINLFSVGDGGCPQGDPFSPILPSPLDLQLANKVPFQNKVAGDNGDNGVDTDKYPVTPSTESGRDLYYYKRFNILDPEWFIDRPTNTVYKKLDLIVDITDCRNEYVNELGLFFSTSTFTQIEMYSRVTFPTESITGNKRILVEYYTFA